MIIIRFLRPGATYPTQIQSYNSSIEDIMRPILEAAGCTITEVIYP